MSILRRTWGCLFGVGLLFVATFVLLQIVMYWQLADNPGLNAAFPMWRLQSRQWTFGGLENYVDLPVQVLILYNGEVINTGDYPRSLPVTGVLFCDYGDNVRCINGYIYPHHTGIDIAAATGNPVQSTIAGTVVYAGTHPDYGNVVIVRNGGIQTLYAHNSELKVVVGQIVNSGQVVALSGSTGNSTGPHVHYEVRQQVGKEWFPISPRLIPQ